MPTALHSAVALNMFLLNNHLLQKFIPQAMTMLGTLIHSIFTFPTEAWQPSADVTEKLSALDYFENVKNNILIENDKHQSEIINFISLFKYIIKDEFKKCFKLTI